MSGEHTRASLLPVKSPIQLVALLAIVFGTVGLGYTVAHIFAASRASASLYLQPATGTYTSGQTVSVKVYVDTDGASVSAVEADFSYPTARLTPEKIDATGSAFQGDGNSAADNGTVKISRQVSGAPVNGSALLVATVDFTADPSGTAALAFLNSSSVTLSSDHANILGTTTGANYTIKGLTPPPATPVPTPTPKPPTTTPTPRPVQPPTPTPVSATTPTPGASATPLAAVASITPTPSGTFATSPTPGSSAVATPASKTVKRSTNVLGVVAAVGIPVVAIILGLVAFVMFRRQTPDVAGPDSGAQPGPAGGEAPVAPVVPAPEAGTEPADADVPAEPAPPQPPAGEPAGPATPTETPETSPEPPTSAGAEPSAPSEAELPAAEPALPPAENPPAPQDDGTPGDTNPPQPPQE